MTTITYSGSHGSFTVCSISGHIIRQTRLVEHSPAPGMLCSLIEEGPSEAYGDIAWIDPTTITPEAREWGEGDVLDVGYLTTAGEYIPALQSVEINDEGDREWMELLALPAPAVN